MNERGGTVDSDGGGIGDLGDLHRNCHTSVAARDLLWIYAILMVEPKDDMSTTVMGVFGAVIYLLHDLF